MDTTPAPTSTAALDRRPPPMSWPAPEDVRSVWIREGGRIGPRTWYYQLVVNEKVHDELTSKTSLTFSQQHDVAAGYREALTGS